MSFGAIAGLVGLNLLYLACGLAVLWLVRGWATWVELVRLAGLAYVAGLALAGTLWTLTLVLGIPFSGWLILATPLVLGAAGVLGGRRLGRARPSLGAVEPSNALVVTAIGVAAAGVFLEALFRSARLAGLYNWDAWSFWVPKGKAIYLFGELDPGFFAALPGSSYPPLVPVLDAAAFHAMGGMDVSTLHLQFWFVGLGFVWALAGLFADRVPSWILWPSILLVLVAPRLGPRFTVPEADLLLDVLFVLAALLVLVWLLDGDRSALVLAAVLLCALVLTKREGMLLALLLVATAAAVSFDRRRLLWRPLSIVGLAAVLVGAPWRIWYLVRGIEGEGGGVGAEDGAERLWPSLRLAFDVLLSGSYWSLIVPIAIGAIALAFLARAYLPAVFVAALVLLITLGGGLITWAVPELEITQELGANPIVRYMGAATLLSAAATPLLLAHVWRAAATEATTR